MLSSNQPFCLSHDSAVLFRRRKGLNWDNISFSSCSILQRMHENLIRLASQKYNGKEEEDSSVDGDGKTGEVLTRTRKKL